MYAYILYYVGKNGLSLRLYFSESKPQDPEVFYREYEYIWTISNFSQIRFLPKGLGFMAPFFHTMSGIEGTADAEWSWGVTPSNNNTAKDHFLALFVRLRNFHEFRDHAKTKKVMSLRSIRKIGYLQLMLLSRLCNPSPFPGRWGLRTRTIA